LDYILCDPWTISQKEEKYFIEKPWRLPDAWLCFAPPEFDIKEGPLPALKNGFITFGCFNNLLKMNDAVVKCWSDVLKMVPNSKLLLKTKQLDFKSMRESTLVNFEKNGIPRNRLLLEGQVSRVELLASYQNVDIALDPFPYMGGITSIEALWMGIPVLSLNGGEFVFSGFGYHIAESTLHNAGLSNWIASSPKNVAVKAKIFSSDLSALAELRGTLRQRLLNSPLCDSQTFADNLTNAFREMWRIFCNQTK
jgi:protein O-GlcNAc transferase